MANNSLDKKESAALLNVLTAHFKALVSAGSDEAVLKQYSSLLRFLRSRNNDFLESLGRSSRPQHSSQRLPTLSERELLKASLDDIEKLVNDEATSRSNLEYIAIQRFSVPRGSMRSFSNRQMLVDKIRTLISNERTHETIRAVARGRRSQRQPTTPH
jgi:hypothetical protein